MKKLLSLGASAIALVSLAGATSASAVYFPDELDPTTAQVIASYEAQNYSSMAQFATMLTPEEVVEGAVAVSTIPGVSGGSLATFLGIDADSLRARLAGGESLASIATSLGVTRDELRGYLLQDYSFELAAAVADESITADEAQVLFAAFAATLDLNIDGTPPTTVTEPDVTVHPDWIAWTVVDDEVVLPTE